MDIIFATDNNFVQHAGVAIMSLLDSNRESKVTIHLFCVDVEKVNVSKIEDIVRLFGADFKAYDITRDLFSEFPDPGVYSIATYLRLLAPSLLPNVSKVIYLDCDIVVNGDLSTLYNTDIDGYSAAGVNDATTSYRIIDSYIGYNYIKEGYANAGVLLLNLDYWRENKIQNKLFQYLSDNNVRLNDQDAINAVLHGTIKFLHPKWNTHVGYFAYPPLVIDDHKKYIKDLWNGAKIIHFTGPAKPWARECVHPYKYIYKKYLKETSWRNVPPIKIEKTLFAAYKIMFLRWAKNIVAKVISYSYKL